jgi:hypothetical protein
MADRNYEGQYRLLAIPGHVANPSAITVAAATAALDLTPSLPTGGISIEGTENNSALAMIDKGFVSESVGTEGATAALTFKRDDDPANDPFFIFSKSDLYTLVEVPFGGQGYAPAVGDDVQVYLVEAHTPRPMTPAENTKQQCMVNFAVSDRDLTAKIVA